MLLGLRAGLRVASPVVVPLRSYSKKGASSKMWQQRQKNDVFVQLRDEQNFRSRAAFKLLEVFFLSSLPSFTIASVLNKKTKTTKRKGTRKVPHRPSRPHRLQGRRPRGCSRKLAASAPPVSFALTLQPQRDRGCRPEPH